MTEESLIVTDIEPFMDEIDGIVEPYGNRRRIAAKFIDKSLIVSNLGIENFF